MEKTEKEGLAGIHLRGMAANILEDVIKADMSMHHAQVELWKSFAEYRPAGNGINPDIHIGFAEERYLCLHEVKLEFHIRPVSSSIYGRLRFSVRHMFGYGGAPVQIPVSFEICSPDDQNAMEISILVKRFENGTISAEYKPADETTRELLKDIKMDLKGSG